MVGETIIVNISAQGDVKIDAQGFRGKSCEKATEQLELVLGGGQVKRKSKPEAFAPAISGAAKTKLTF